MSTKYLPFFSVAASWLLLVVATTSSTTGAVLFASAAKCNSYVIVGAGISGLGAASALIEGGVPGSAITILEARNRTGGRIFTDTTSLGPDSKAEMGAAWIHGGGPENPIRILSDKYGGNTIEADDVVDESFKQDGTLMTAEEMAEAQNRAEVNMLASRFGGPTRSLRNSLNSKFKTEDNAAQVWRARLEFDTSGPDSSWSVQNFMTTGEKFEGPELIFKNGYSSVIIDGLVNELTAAGVTFRLSTEVSQVTHSSSSCGGVTLSTTSSSGSSSSTTTVSAEAAIVTVPLGVLKAPGAISFSPALPQAHQEAIARMRMGNAGKVFARFPNDFWSSEIGAQTFIFSVEIPNATDDATRGRNFQFFNLQRDFGVPILHTFMSGDYVTEADSKTDAAMLDDFMASLRIAFPSAPNPTHFLRTNWGADPYARGSYTTWAGTERFYPEDYETLASPVSASLMLAGEHTSTYVSSVHGAYLSGQDAANRLM